MKIFRLPTSSTAFPSLFYGFSFHYATIDDEEKHSRHKKACFKIYKTAISFNELKQLSVSLRALVAVVVVIIEGGKVFLYRTKIAVFLKDLKGSFEVSEREFLKKFFKRVVSSFQCLLCGMVKVIF